MGSSLRERVRRTTELRRLPAAVAVFHWRAHRLAAQIDDSFGPMASTRPRKLAELLRLAEGRRRVVELGTAAGWTSISLLIADRRRLVTTYDIHERPWLDRYATLAPAGVRERLTAVHGAGEQGPSDAQPIDLLYIDSSHEREPTLREVAAWRPVLAPGSLIVFDDFGHHDYPGVEAAVRELGLDGEVVEGLFVHWAGGAGAHATGSA